MNDLQVEDSLSVTTSPAVNENKGVCFFQALFGEGIGDGRGGSAREEATNAARDSILCSNDGLAKTESNLWARRHDLPDPTSLPFSACEPLMFHSIGISDT